MSATVNEQENPFSKGDRVLLTKAVSVFPNKKGTIVRNIGISSEVKLDNNQTVITYFKNLKKVKKKNA